MTYEEAIKELKEWREFAEKRGSYYGEKAIPTYDLAIEALEKQIPKKPNDYYEDSVDDECAVWGTIVFERDRYCPRCGQAIDWGE